jgi:hypothetical protein
MIFTAENCSTQLPDEIKSGGFEEIGILEKKG